MGSRRSRIVWGGVLAVGIAAGCAPADPLPRRGGTAPPGLPADGLLERPALQAVVESALRRDGAEVRDAFRDPDPEVRARAALTMASVRDLGAAPELRALLGDGDPRVRAAAAFALGHYSGAGDAGEQMGEILETETDPAVRAALIDALGKAGYSRALGVLLELDGPDRAAATLALSRAVVRGAPPGGAVDTLVDRMDDADPAVRRNAAYFMERVEDPLLWIDHRGDIRTALDALPVDDPAAMSIVDGLGRRFDVFTLPRILFRARHASDWRVRANAMAALDGMGQGEERLGTLLDGLLDPSVHVRTQAATALASAPPAPDVQAWLEAWIEDHPRDLAPLGPVLLLLSRAGDADAVLGWTGRLAADDAAGWAVAVPALTELAGEGALLELVRATRSPDPRIARSAAAALRTRVETGLGFGAESSFVELLAGAVAGAHADAVGPLAEALVLPGVADAGGTEAVAAAWREASGSDAARRRTTLARVLADAGAVDVLTSLGVDPSEGASPPTPAPRTYPTVDWVELSALGPRPRLTLETERGRIVVEMAADLAPLTVQTLARLVRGGRFDGVPFHRVVPNFVIQGGDLARGPTPLPPAPRLRTEITPIPFERGVAGMANTGALDTETSQFFITHDRQPHLDGGYTSFGWVVEGMDVVDRIGPGDRVLRARVTRTF